VSARRVVFQGNPALAPLKRSLRLPTRPRAGRFPGQSSPGPIEALGAVDLSTVEVRFPGQSSPGPIEARLTARGDHPTVAFSRAIQPWPH